MSAPAAAGDASYAAEVARLLWPEPHPAPYLTRARHRAGDSHRDVYVFPSERRPRMLVPADVPGSASMVQRLGGRSPLVRPVKHVLERSLRSRAFPLLRWPMVRVPGADGVADSVEDHLARCLGHEVRVGVLLGTRRVNQKPVLQVYAPDGRLCAYAKVGHNDLTADLVRREAASLTAVADRRPRTFRLPQLLDHSRWGRLEVLLVSALATRAGAPVPDDLRRAAMREVAELAGTTCVPLATSRFWLRLRGCVAALHDEPHGPRLAAALAAIEASAGDERVHLGGWHGDWGAWNTGMGADGLNIWDWERYDADVPLGFDGLHHAASTVRPGSRDARRQEEAFLRSVPATLAALEVPASQHDLTLRLYLLEVAVRYVDALTHGATPALARRTSWVLSLLERLSEPSTALSPEGRP